MIFHRGGGEDAGVGAVRDLRRDRVLTLPQTSAGKNEDSADRFVAGAQAMLYQARPGT